MFQWFFVTCFLLISFTSSLKSSMDTLQLDVDDILRADLMPTTFLMIDSAFGGNSKDTSDEMSSRLGDDEIESKIMNSDDILVDKSPSIDTPENPSDGDIFNALSTMRFHRNKFNEYLCNNFLASQIMSNIIPRSPVDNQTEFSSRLGLLPNDYPSFNVSASIGVLPLGLVDVGSHGYRNWLQKTAAFENANKQNHATDRVDNVVPTSNMSSLSGADGGARRNRNDIYDYETGDYIEGDVSGYAYQKPMEVQPNNIVETQQQTHPQPPAAMNPYLAINHGIEDFKHQNTDGSRTLHKAPPPTVTHPIGTVVMQQHVVHPGYQLYAPIPIETHLIGPGVEEGFALHEDHEYHHHHHHDYKSSKALGLKEFFEIALTTLAFLAFGMFMLQVIMCITMENPGMDSSMVVSPMEGSAELDPIQEEVRRKRAVPVANPAKINELARIVLVSIDSAHSAEEDHGQCLYRTLCETNKLSRSATGRMKYFIPLWGLGMTWFSPRVVKNQPRMHSILDGIKASALGLGNANCKQIYAKCDFEKQNLSKEKYRKKRSIKNIDFDWY